MTEYLDFAEQQLFEETAINTREHTFKKNQAARLRELIAGEAHISGRMFFAPRPENLSAIAVKFSKSIVERNSGDEAVVTLTDTEFRRLVNFFKDVLTSSKESYPSEKIQAHSFGILLNTIHKEAGGIPDPRFPIFA